jgi:hypothetical protein
LGWQELPRSALFALLAECFDDGIQCLRRAKSTEFETVDFEKEASMQCED